MARSSASGHSGGMIISASYRTDIPAFYGRWFINRFRAGWAKVVNPHGGQVSTIPLRAGVDGFVFWTRNIGPFRPALDEVRASGLPFTVQYTVTGYPRALETSVIASDRAVALMAELAARHGRRTVVWRYDPILVTSLTPPDWHRETFARLAAGLEGTVDEVSVSFAHIYRKTRRNLAVAARAHGFAWDDPPSEVKRALIRDLAELAAARGMALSLCSQPDWLAEGIAPSRCVDARRLEDVAAGWGAPRPVKARPKGNRPGCLCFESRDLGDYDTCPHGCVYCYAVSARAQARRRHDLHDPDGEFLFPPANQPPPPTPNLF